MAEPNWRAIAARGSHALSAINVCFVDHVIVPARGVFASPVHDSVDVVVVLAVDVDRVRVVAVRYVFVVHDAVTKGDATHTFQLLHGDLDPRICKRATRERMLIQHAKQLQMNEKKKKKCRID